MTSFVGITLGLVRMLLAHKLVMLFMMLSVSQSVMFIVCVVC
jgi:hypothetical protein